MSVTTTDTILITGATGFIGSHLKRQLLDRGYRNIVDLDGYTEGFDLGESENVGWLFDNTEPDIVIHLAARNGGFEYNASNSGGIMYENINMGIKVLEEARQYNCKKFIMVGDISCYGDVDAPFREQDLWDLYPNYARHSYGLSKRFLLNMSFSYASQFGMNCINPILSDVYGAGQRTDPRFSNFLPSSIFNIVNATQSNEEVINILGDPDCVRDFLHVSDACSSIINLMEYHENPSIINIGRGDPRKISDILEIITKMIGYSGKIEWNIDKPIEQKYRYLDVSKSKFRELFQPKITLEEGLSDLLTFVQDKFDAVKLHPANSLPPSEL